MPRRITPVGDESDRQLCPYVSQSQLLKSNPWKCPQRPAGTVGKAPHVTVHQSTRLHFETPTLLVRKGFRCGTGMVMPDNSKARDFLSLT